MELTRTQRLLALYHLFIYSEEVSADYVNEFFCEKAGVTLDRKMIARDMELLRNAALIRYRYSDSRGAYIPEKARYTDYENDENDPLGERNVPGFTDVDEKTENPVFPDGAKKRAETERLIRLCRIMRDIYGDDDPYESYRRLFPECSEKQMSEDFNELRYVSYGFYKDNIDNNECYVWENDIFEAFDFWFVEKPADIKKGAAALQMYITIHRGTEQIGGNLIEIGADNTRIMFDAGTNLPPLDGTPAEDNFELEGLTKGKPDFDFVYLSHHHNDHTGLLSRVLPETPIISGEKTRRILNVIADFTGQKRPEINFGFRDGCTLNIHDEIFVTPFSVSHSAEDSYMFLIQCEDHNILYTGDFSRADGVPEKIREMTHGKPLDIMICEGTNIARESAFSKLPADGKTPEERLYGKLEKELMKGYDTVFVLCSSTNEERILSVRKAAEKSGRQVCEDLFMTAVRGKKNDSAQKFVANYIDKDKMTRAYRYFEKYYGKRELVGAESLAKIKGKKVIFVRASMTRFIESYIAAREGNGKYALIYSMWNGYKETPKIKAFRSFFEERNIPIIDAHVSGHAYRSTIEALINELEPKKIFPIHCDKNDREEFLGISDKCEMLKDGERFYLKGAL